MRGLDRGERAALVVSECQPAIVDPRLAMFAGLAQQVETRGILARIATLAAASRAAALPVIHCTIRLRPEARGFTAASPLHAAMQRNPLLRTDRAESDVDPLLADASDFISERHHGLTGFHGTDLEALLRGLGVTTIILAGVSTDIALPGMAIEATNRGFAVVIPEDCTAGASPETHDHAVGHILPMLATVTNADAVMTQLGGID